MLDLQPRLDGEPEIVPVRKLAANVAGVYAAPHGRFQTEAVAELVLGFDGIVGDFHAGQTRRSGSREPWYARGTEMRNERQLSIVAPDELAVIAGRMGLAELKPEWIGANLLLDGIPSLSMLPSGTLLFFKGGVTIKIDAQNGPCRYAGSVDRRKRRHARPRSGVAAVSKGGETAARAGRVGGETRPDRYGRRDFGARAGAVDLPGRL